MFNWFRRKRALPKELFIDSPEKSREYREVAALVCHDLDLLKSIANASDMTKDELVWHVNDYHDKKEKYIKDKTHREQQYALTNMLYTIGK